MEKPGHRQLLFFHQYPLRAATDRRASVHEARSHLWNEHGSTKLIGLGKSMHAGVSVVDLQ